MRPTRLLCLFAGGFLLTAAVLAQVWLPGHVLRTPLNVDNTTHLSGTAESMTFSGTQPVKVVNMTQVIPSLSSDTDVAWGSRSCVVIDAAGAPACPHASDTRWTLVNASTDTYASSRTSGEGVSDKAALPTGIDPSTGLVNKFPFHAQKKDYAYWDSTLGAAATARYTGTATLRGLTTYVYRMTIPTTTLEISPGIEGTYRNTTTFYADPLTGALVNQVTDMSTQLTNGTTALAMKIAFTPDQVASGVADAKRHHLQILLALTIAPIACALAGLAFLGTALMLARRDRRAGLSPARKAPRARPRLPLRGAHA
ncbi:DUF3068 domain-containing protein [Nocardioides sp.]|uniref:DUF3068 domain-containing protein n=1 Tax=Nocardioides sp. TaxID=35761 RepID=UPI00262B4F86|nr:DUF3068 domain-containing protein [Nocardioides sp.]